MDLSALVTKPLGLVVSCFSVAALAWWNLVKSVWDFNVAFFLKLFVWLVGVVSLPVRILTALQTEATLKMHLREQQGQLESLAWENKGLEDRLQRAIKERKIMETVFQEVEEDLDKALSRIDLLEAEVQDLKEENMRLSRIHGKAVWDYKARDDKIGSWNENTLLTGNCKLPSWGTGCKPGGTVREDIIMRGDSWGDLHKNKSQEQSPFRTPITPQMSGRDITVDEILERQRLVALHRSLFSSMLSLIVGMIIWKAEDPCMPLVVALFTVVGMSLNSVVQFFSTVKNKPASDAVALLSVNWFILGTITYPTLPTVARVLAPRVIKLADKFLFWFGFSY